jgi:glycosyltransferase involved in cell wall biosynthesis
MLVKIINDQTYQNIKEWIIVDGRGRDEACLDTNGENSSESLLESLKRTCRVKNVLYAGVGESADGSWPALSDRRNTANIFATGDFIVNMDDDDYYAPLYIQSALSILRKSLCDIAWVSALPIYHHGLGFQCQYPDGTHGTNGTFVYRRHYLETHKYAPGVGVSEEESFTAGFTVQAARLDPKTFVCSAHRGNTYDKTPSMISSLSGKSNLKLIPVSMPKWFISQGREAIKASLIKTGVESEISTPPLFEFVDILGYDAHNLELLVAALKGDAKLVRTGDLDMFAPHHNIVAWDGASGALASVLRNGALIDAGALPMPVDERFITGTPETEGLVRQPHRACHVGPPSKTIELILDIIWPAVLEVHADAELHLFLTPLPAGGIATTHHLPRNVINEKLKALTLRYNGKEHVVVHEQFTIDDVLREAFQSNFALYTSSVTDPARGTINQFAAAGCIPIVCDQNCHADTCKIQVPLGNVANAVVQAMSLDLETHRAQMRETMKPFTPESVAKMWRERIMSP